MVKIKFPDGNVKEFESGVTGMDIAKSISHKLAKEVLSISVNGVTWDLMRGITTDSEIKLYTWDDEEGRHAFWHSSAHLMAKLCRLFTRISSSVSVRQLKMVSTMTWTGRRCCYPRERFGGDREENVGIGKKKRGVLQDRR